MPIFAQASASSGYGGILITISLLVFAIYLLVIRPKQKRQNESDFNQLTNSDINSVSAERPESIPSAAKEFSVALRKRYSDAYNEAHAIVTIGKTIKIIAIILSIVATVSGFALSAEQRGNDYLWMGGIIVACIIGIPVYILGILVSAQGQTSLATLDTAVNSSRNLSDEDVTKVMMKRWSM